MEYLSLVSSESDEQDFLRQIGLLDVEADEEEETSEADVDNSETEPDTEEELIPEEQMLPINYSLFSQTGEKTPEKAVKKFYMSLKKQDVGTAVCMGKNGEDAEKDFEKFVDCQEERPATQQQTAERLGISRSYVSRLEKRALARLMNTWRK